MRQKLEAFSYIAILLAALLACGKGSSSRRSPGSNADDSPQPTETAVSVAATDLMADYKGNEVRGDSKWKGKLVLVTGIVGDIKKDILDKPYVTLGSGAAFEIPEVQCSLRSGQEGAAGSLQKGQRATLKGRVHGLMMNVQLDDCELMPSAPAAPPPGGTPRPAAAPAPQPAPHPATPPARPRKR
jgi:hypothetical protein